MCAPPPLPVFLKKALCKAAPLMLAARDAPFHPRRGQRSAWCLDKHTDPVKDLNGPHTHTHTQTNKRDIFVHSGITHNSVVVVF